VTFGATNVIFSFQSLKRIFPKELETLWVTSTGRGFFAVLK